MLRSTTAIFWIPLVMHDIWNRVSFSTFLSKMLPQSFLVPLSVILVDSFMYGQLTIVPWNFLRINVLHSISDQYGIEPFHWYIYNFLAPIVGIVGLYPLMLGTKNSWQRNDPIVKLLIGSLLWSFAAYSGLTHKEHRFMIPLIPIILALMTMGAMAKKSLVNLFCSANVAIAMYLSIFHQVGPHAVMRYLSSKENVHGVVFLTHCHATPLYCYLHKDIPTRTLECPPDLGDNPVQEADQFKLNPLKWTLNQVNLQTYDHVVLYEQNQALLKDHLIKNGFNLCKTFRHADFVTTSAESSKITIYCRDEEI